MDHRFGRIYLMLELIENVAFNLFKTCSRKIPNGELSQFGLLIEELF
jgi:hypothetical protein